MLADALTRVMSAAVLMFLLRVSHVGQRALRRHNSARRHNPHPPVNIMRQSILQQSSSQIVGAVHDAAFAEVVVGREVEAVQPPAVDQVNAHKSCP
jgi:hypothetical protein